MGPGKKRAHLCSRAQRRFGPVLTACLLLLPLLEASVDCGPTVRAALLCVERVCVSVVVKITWLSILVHSIQMVMNGTQ